MIDLVTGLPGAGKGVYMMLRIIDELKNTERPIITNFALRLQPWNRPLGKRRSRPEKGLLQYLLDTYGETFNAEKRIHVLDDEDMQVFYLWRCTPDFKLTKIAAEYSLDGSISKIDESEWSNTLPTWYGADEGWKFWNSRNWQRQDKGIQFYNAQHRKAGDDLMITTQHLAQIDKQMRVLVQTYHSLVNHGKRKMGIFRQPAVISVFETNEPPEAGRKSLGAAPKVVKFDKAGLGGCFDTAQGAGVQGGAADILHKTKGLPPWGMLLLVILIGGALISVSRGAGWLTGYVLGGHSKPAKAVEKAAQSYTPVTSGPVTQTRQMDDSKVVVSNAVYAAMKAKADEIHLTGYATLNGKLYVTLSDGFVYSENVWLLADKRSCVVNGTTYRMASTASRVLEPKSDVRRYAYPSF
jgi:hypothetical protein